MPKVRDWIISQEIYKAVRDYLPEDHARPQTLPDYTAHFCALSPTPERVLDLGCGEGTSMELFERLNPAMVWCGVDIEDSPEVKQRVRQSDRIANFNGVDLPYRDKYFDLIFCHQVLEHVRYECLAVHGQCCCFYYRIDIRADYKSYL
jgi:ubiquinone/menaquinone biosynthesis C-methylase UbiE